MNTTHSMITIVCVLLLHRRLAPALRRRDAGGRAPQAGRRDRVQGNIIAINIIAIIGSPANSSTFARHGGPAT